MLGWDQSQVRTWDGLNRHTALAALAQLRAAAIRNAINGDITLTTAPDGGGAAPGASTDSADDADDAGLVIPLGDAPVPARGGQPCPPRAAQAAAGLITRARLAFALRWSARRRRHQAIARWHHHSARLTAVADTGAPQDEPGRTSRYVTASR